MMDKRTRIDWNGGTGTAYTAVAVSEFGLNLQAADKELGISNLILHILVKTSFDGLNAGVNLQLIDASNINLTTDQRILSEIPAVAMADMAAQKHYMIPIPPRKLQQFLGMRFEPVGTDSTVGNIIAWFDEQAESEVV